MKKYRMLTSGEHDRLTAGDFRSFGSFTDPGSAKRTQWVCEGGEHWSLMAWLSGTRLVEEWF